MVLPAARTSRWVGHDVGERGVITWVVGSDISSFNLCFSMLGSTDSYFSWELKPRNQYQPGHLFDHV